MPVPKRSSSAAWPAPPRSTTTPTSAAPWPSCPSDDQIISRPSSSWMNRSASSRIAIDLGLCVAFALRDAEGPAPDLTDGSLGAGDVLGDDDVHDLQHRLALRQHRVQLLGRIVAGVVDPERDVVLAVCGHRRSGREVIVRRSTRVDCNPSSLGLGAGGREVPLASEAGLIGLVWADVGDGEDLAVVGADDVEVAPRVSETDSSPSTTSQSQLAIGTPPHCGGRESATPPRQSSGPCEGDSMPSPCSSTVAFAS